MKSFFKKLAFVMALAMVVSMAAPAAPVAYAAGEIFFAMQDSTSESDYITSLNVKVGEEVDLKFYGASNWKNNIKLVSSDTNVLAVTDNDYCKVKGVSEGRTTLTLTIVDQFVSIPVKVGNPAPEYIVEHKTADSIDVVFAGAHEYAKSDITLYRIYESSNGDIRVNWPINTIESTDKGFRVTPYVTFQNEDRYILTVGDEDVKLGEGFAFEINVGEPNRLVATYSCLNDPGKAYVDLDTNEELPVKINVKYYYNDVDLTANYQGGPDTYFELAWASNEDAVSLDEGTGELYFSELGVAARVGVTYSYEDEYGEIHSVSTRVDDIVSTKVTPYKVEGVVDWTIVKVGTPAKDVVWGEHKLPANDDGRNSAEYRILAVLLDNRGNYLVNDFATGGESYLNSLPAAVATTIRNSNGKVAAYDVTNNNYKFAADGNVLEFSSANVYKMLVGKDGSLTTYTDATVPAIVSIVNDSGEKTITKNVSALEIEVQKERKIDKIVLKNDGVTVKSINVVTDSTEEQFEIDGTTTTEEFAKFTQEKIYVELYDQYNVKWHKNETIDVSSKAEGAVLGLLGLTSNTITYDAEKGFATFTVDGALMKEKSTKSAPSIDLSIKDVKPTASLKVTLKNPRYVDDAKTVISLSTSIKLQATTPVDLKIMDSYNVVLTSGATTTREAYKTAKVSLTEISNTLEVGAQYNVLYYDGFNLYDENGIATTKATDGQYVVSVYDTKSNILPMANFTAANSVKDFKTAEGVYANVPTGADKAGLGVINNGDGTLDIVFAYSNGGLMTYAETGNYSVKVTAFDYYEKTKADGTVLKKDFWVVGDLGEENTWNTTDPKANTVSLKFKSSVRINATVAVSNSSAKITELKMTDDVTEKLNAKDIVHELIDVKLAGKAWDFAVEDILTVYGRYNDEADYIIITAIDFKVPLNQTDAEKTSKDPVGYVERVVVNKSVKVGDNFVAGSLTR